MRSILGFCICLMLSASAVAQEKTRTFISPGVKFGYQFDAGFFAGLEVSYSIHKGEVGLNYGASFNLDLMRGSRIKLSLSAQGGHIVGVQVGPALLIDPDNLSWGISTVVYGLSAFMPYYGYSYFPDTSITEAGLLVKIPLLSTGPELDLFKM